MLDRKGPRFPDMPQMATPPSKTANLNLFPYQYGYLIPPPPLATQDIASQGPFIVLLVLGVALLLLSLME